MRQLHVVMYFHFKICILCYRQASYDQYIFTLKKSSFVSRQVFKRQSSRVHIRTFLGQQPRWPLLLSHCSNTQATLTGTRLFCACSGLSGTTAHQQSHDPWQWVVGKDWSHASQVCSHFFNFIISFVAFVRHGGSIKLFNIYLNYVFTKNTDSHMCSILYYAPKQLFSIFRKLASNRLPIRSQKS